MSEGRKLYPLADSQNYLGGISRTTLWALAKSGEISQVNIGRRAFITRESMDSYVDTLAARGDAA